MYGIKEETKSITLKDKQDVSWVGLDENGQAIVRLNGNEIFLSPIDILEKFGDLNLI
jgi:hypothetical protein